MEEDAATPDAAAPSCTLYIRNLNFKCKRGALLTGLRDVFEQFGKILDIHVPDCFHLKGTAWVVFTEQTAAAEGLKEMEGFMFFDRPLWIQYATAKSDVVARADGTFKPRPKRVKNATESAEPKRRKRRKRKRAAPPDVPPSRDVAPPRDLVSPPPSFGPPGFVAGPGRGRSVSPPPGPAALPHGFPPPHGLPPGLPPGFPPPGFPPGHAPPPLSAAGARVPAAVAASSVPTIDPTLPPNKILFAETLPESVGQRELEALFSDARGLAEVRHFAGRRVAFIEFCDALAAGEALRRLCGHSLSAFGGGSARLRINYAKL
jgi:hypothetical protein